AKIEIGLELRQLVLLSLGTMTFSGSLFAIGYYLGTRDGLRSAVSPATEIVRVDRSLDDKRRDRVKPTKAALGEVEFLFAKPTPKKKHLTAEPVAIRRQANSVAEVRRLPKLKSRSTGRPSGRVEVELPALPAVPARLTKASKRDSKPVKPKIAERIQVSTQKVDVKTLEPVVRNETPLNLSELAASVDGELASTSKSNSVPQEEPATKAQKNRTPVSKPAVAKGTSTPVRVTQIAEARKSSKAKEHGHFFTVQVKAVTDKAEADKYSAQLRSHGLKPNVVLADIPEKGRYYRIRLGKFASMDEARQFQKQIRRKGTAKVRGFVTRY
ncbi:MAG: SPOR domain-containing protein, partial [Bradymonadia bacterium]